LEDKAANFSKRNLLAVFPSENKAVSGLPLTCRALCNNAEAANFSKRNLLAVLPSEDKAANFSKRNLLGSGNLLNEVLEEHEGNEATSELRNNVEEEVLEG